MSETSSCTHCGRLIRFDPYKQQWLHGAGNRNRCPNGDGTTAEPIAPLVPSETQDTYQ